MANPSDPSSHLGPRFPVTRRRLIAGGSSALVLGLLSTRLAALAQDTATPAPAAEEQGAAPATPTAALPTIPPELKQFAGDWPTPQANLSNHRATANSSIKSGNVTSLEVAWSFPIEATSGFG